MYRYAHYPVLLSAQTVTMLYHAVVPISSAVVLFLLTLPLVSQTAMDLDDKNSAQFNLSGFSRYEEAAESDVPPFCQQMDGSLKNVQERPYWARKRILVTGGAGFIGSHLVDRLMSNGHEVIVVDNLFTGRRDNIAQWLGHPRFEFIRHDVVQPLFVECDEIYHLASPASPPHYMFNPVKTIKTNTIGTINMLGLAKRTGAKFLFASSSEVYGDPEVNPQPETYWGHVNPIGPRSCYDEGKRAGETLSYAYAEREKVNVRIARIFNTYGPRMDVEDGRVVSNFVWRALLNNPLVVYGSGNQTRSLQYVSDLVDGLIALMKSNYTQPVNLGNPNEMTINQFAETILKSVNGTRSIITHDKAVVDEPQRRKPVIALAERVLGWKPKVDLKDGLECTTQYFRDLIVKAKKFRKIHEPVLVAR